jgi:hypothetical protein
MNQPENVLHRGIVVCRGSYSCTNLPSHKWSVRSFSKQRATMRHCRGEMLMIAPINSLRLLQQSSTCELIDMLRKGKLRSLLRLLSAPWTSARLPVQRLLP